MPVEIELPYPPSLNHYYRRVGSKTLISRAGRRYREQVCAILRVLRVPELAGRLAMEVDLYPPDRRRRDLDNAQKGLWDALAHGGLYRDDSQIKEFACRMLGPMPDGKAVVRVRRLLGVEEGQRLG
jgi:crossover junction endodeoxyribonuclease RusA